MSLLTKLTRLLLYIVCVVAVLKVHGPLSGNSNVWPKGASCARLTVFDSANYDEIETRLFLGTAKAASDPRILKSLNLTHILTIDNHPIPKHVFLRRNITTLYIKANDNPRQVLIPYFPMTNAFIEEGVNAGGIMVHCHYGISRSATLVIAYCMEKYNLTYDKALKYVRSRRPFINPNPGFEQQLREYYRNRYEVKGLSKFEIIHVKALKHKYKIASLAMLLACMVIPLAVIV